MIERFFICVEDKINTYPTKRLGFPNFGFAVLGTYPKLHYFFVGKVLNMGKPVFRVCDQIKHILTGQLKKLKNVIKSYVHAAEI